MCCRNEREFEGSQCRSLVPDVVVDVDRSSAVDERGAQAHSLMCRILPIAGPTENKTSTENNNESSKERGDRNRDGGSQSKGSS